MSSEIQCFDDPESIREKRFCLNAVSKNVKGELELVDATDQKCEKPACGTLKTVHVFSATVDPAPCDSKLSAAFDGKLVVRQLVTAFDQDGMQRGFHAGDFEWSGASVRIAGRMSGMTNVGTHREPAFKPCQRCDTTGVMEGRLCGQVIDAKDEERRDCQIMAAYRLNFDPSTKGGGGAIQGVIEGVSICLCR